MGTQSRRGDRTHLGKWRVRFVSIADNSRTVNVTRPDALRPVCKQGKHFIRSFATCFLSTYGKNFELLCREPVCEFDCQFCGVEFKPLLVCVCTVQARMKANRDAPRLLRRRPAWIYPPYPYRTHGTASVEALAAVTVARFEFVPNTNRKTDR